MRPQLLHVEQLEASRLEMPHRPPGRDQSPVGEDVGRHEGAFGARADVGRIPRDDSVVEEQAAVRGEPVRDREVAAEVVRTDVLEHAHRGHGIEAAVELAVVGLQDAHPIGQTGGGDALSPGLGLGRRQGDATPLTPYRSAAWASSDPSRSRCRAAAGRDGAAISGI